jgi:hypothetical protein
MGGRSGGRLQPEAVPWDTPNGGFPTQLVVREVGRPQWAL